MLNIAIDGPSGSGKSTIAKGVAAALNILHLDTGAMYRALALKALRLGLDPLSAADIEPMLPCTRITVEFSEGKQTTLIDGEDVTAFIRTQEVAKGASDIGTIPAVRAMMVESQQGIANTTDVIMDGRDIGSCVMPNTKYKFFVTADVQERARRRNLEMRAKDSAYSKTVEDTVNELTARDLTDSSRACAPLTHLGDAMYIDTTNLTIEEAVNAVLKRVCKEED